MNLESFDPFVDALGSNNIDNVDQTIVHIRIQQRTARNYLTIIEGIDSQKYDLMKLAKAMAKKFCCGCSISGNGSVIVLNGDQRKNASSFVNSEKLASNSRMVIHGF